MVVGFRYGQGADLDLYSPAAASEEPVLSGIVMSILTRRGEWYGDLRRGLDIAALQGSDADIRTMLESDIRRELAGMVIIRLLTLTVDAARRWTVSLICDIGDSSESVEVTL